MKRPGDRAKAASEQRTGPPSQWLESPHLLRAEGGAAAVAGIDELPAAERDEVVAVGDRLAEIGVAVAHAYVLRAAEARRALGAGAFRRWTSAGLRLAGERIESREAATAFFRLDPLRLASSGARLLDRWIELCLEVARFSRRLGVVFLESTGRVLDRLPEETRLERLEAWARAGLALGGSNGWRGEFLAAAYFAAGEAVLPVLAPDEIAAWAALGARLQVGREVNTAYFKRLPERLDALAPDDRALLFRLADRAADASARAAAALFAGLPSALLGVEIELHRVLLSVFVEAAREAEAMARLLPFLGALLRAVPAPARRPLIERVAGIARHHPECAAPLLRSLPRACEESDPAGVARWMERGEAIAGASRAAGVAYFAVESRTSIHMLRRTSAAARLEDVLGTLRSFARMLAGAPVTLHAADGASLRPFLDLESLDQTTITLPAKVDVFDSWEGNFALLKLATANGAARAAYGTFALSLRRVAERLPPALADVLRRAVDGDGLRDLLQALPEADPLLALFAACEGARIDARLRAAYRGYAADLRATARELEAVARRSAASASAELLFFLVGAGVPADAVAGDDLPAELVEALGALLSSPAATVDDSLAVAIQLRERLADSIAVSGIGATEFEELVFEKLAGDGLVDAEPRERDGDGGAPRPTEVVDVDPEAVEQSDERGRGVPLSAEEIRRLLEAGAILKVGGGRDMIESAGIFATGLVLPPDAASEPDEGGAPQRSPSARRAASERREFRYDEWDYQIRDYRSRWCRLEEIALAGDAGEFFQETLVRYADLLPEVRRQFQRIRPERTSKIRGLEDGEDFDLNAVVTARVDRRARRTPSSRLYVARRREERDVATLFLLDMSASTDEALAPPPSKSGGEDSKAACPRGARPRRIIDVTKEALVIMAEALEELGDRYAIYGFSGQGRENVEFYRVKHFNEGLTPGVRGRIGGIEPRRSTRMGTAIRHAIAKMASLSARSKHVLLLSDGFPQDFDYGSDRRSSVYGIQDTMVAFQECLVLGITPFCITVDKTGHDYLRQMCESSRYLVIEDVASLPTELPKIYQRWVQA